MSTERFIRNKKQRKLSYMGWFFVTLIIPIFSTIGMLFVMKLVPAPVEYKQKAEVLRAVRDGQLGWVVIGIGSGLLYETFSLNSPNYFVATFVIIVIFVNAVISAFGIMFPFQEVVCPPSGGTFTEKVKVYQILSATVFSLVLISGLYIFHHFYIVVSL